MAKVVEHAAALRAPAEHKLVPRMGWLHLGELPVPTQPILGPAACLPPDGAADGSLHLLKPRNGEVGLPFTWLAGLQQWQPHGRGRREAFRPVYLAAHGWQYQGAYDPTQVEEA